MKTFWLKLLSAIKLRSDTLNITTLAGAIVVFIKTVFPDVEIPEEAIAFLFVTLAWFFRFITNVALEDMPPVMEQAKAKIIKRKKSPVKKK